MQTAHQLTDDIFYHSLITIIPDTRYRDPPFIGITNIDIGTFGGIERATHSNVFHIRTTFKYIPVDTGGVTQKHRIGISDTGNDFIITRGYIRIHHHLTGK